jgi:hypothetical protein
MVMVLNGLALGLLETIGFGWISMFLMLVCLYAWKGDFKSSYNYRPKWAQVDLPEDVSTKIDKEGAKWIVFTVGAFWCAMIIGWVYSLVSGNFNALQFILLASFVGWVLILLALVVVVYLHAWFAEKKYKTGKT